MHINYTYVVRLQNRKYMHMYAYPSCIDIVGTGSIINNELYWKTSYGSSIIAINRTHVTFQWPHLRARRMKRDTSVPVFECNMYISIRPASL